MKIDKALKKMPSLLIVNQWRIYSIGGIPTPPSEKFAMGDHAKPHFFFADRPIYALRK